MAETVPLSASDHDRDATGMQYVYAVVSLRTRASPFGRSPGCLAAYPYRSFCPYRTVAARPLLPID